MASLEQGCKGHISEGLQGSEVEEANFPRLSFTPGYAGGLPGAFPGLALWTRNSRKELGCPGEAAGTQSQGPSLRQWPWLLLELCGSELDTQCPVSTSSGWRRREKLSAT